MEVDQHYPLLLLKCSGTITKLILIPIPWPSITARSDADAAQCYPKDSQGFVCGEKKKRKSHSVLLKHQAHRLLLKRISQV